MPGHSKPEDRLPTVGLSISVDTEEDNWDPTVENVTVRNIGEIPKIEAMFRSLGIRGTYFTTYQVASNPESADIIRELHAESQSEIGMHLHPWNTPPLFGIEPRISMLRNYPAEVQQQKLERLLEEFHTSLEVQPTSFRAGRFGVGRATIEALIRNGIHVDSSVTPLLTWESQGGPSFIGAPNLLYRLNGTDDVRSHFASGVVVEVPVTVGFTRFAPESWARIAELFARPLARRLHIPGFAYRTGIVQRVILTPETYTAEEMLRVSRRFIEAGAPYLHMYLHSSSLLAGLSPFGETQQDVDGIYEAIRGFVEGLRRFAVIEPCTVTEAAHRYAPPRAPESSTDGIDTGFGTGIQRADAAG
jgi:hypothetical protein